MAWPKGESPVPKQFTSDNLWPQPIIIRVPYSTSQSLGINTLAVLAEDNMSIMPSKVVSKSKLHCKARLQCWADRDVVAVNLSY